MFGWCELQPMSQLSDATFLFLFLCAMFETLFILFFSSYVIFHHFAYVHRLFHFRIKDIHTTQLYKIYSDDNKHENIHSVIIISWSCASKRKKNRETKIDYQREMSESERQDSKMYAKWVTDIGCVSLLSTFVSAYIYVHI